RTSRDLHLLKASFYAQWEGDTDPFRLHCSVRPHCGCMHEHVSCCATERVRGSEQARKTLKTSRTAPLLFFPRKHSQPGVADAI
ncbi:hypothetical protein BD626DRAFT_607928, partial [Schizophyllum amplum]